MNELQLPSKCIVFRNGIEIWIPAGEKLSRFENALDNLQTHVFVSWEGRRMNTADMVGIYLPEDMEDMKRRKNGEWVCNYGRWHQRKQECGCAHIPRSNEGSWGAPEEISDEQRARNVEALAKVRANLKIKNV